MEYLITDFDKEYLLHTPMSFILQYNSKEKIETLHDENGWTITHYSVAEADVSKIKELIHFGFNFGINSINNHIYSEFFQINDKKKSPDKIEVLNKIPFNKSGFNAINLCLFFFNYYTKISKQNGNDFFYSNLANKYQEILSLLLNRKNIDNTNYQDKNGKSFFDYAFLLENISLIEYIHMLDSDFKTLHKVDLKTAKEILEVLQIKNSEGNHPHLINHLNSKIFNQKLQNELTIKNNSSDKQKNKKI